MEKQLHLLLPHLTLPCLSYPVSPFPCGLANHDDATPDPSRNLLRNLNMRSFQDCKPIVPAPASLPSLEFRNAGHR